MRIATFNVENLDDAEPGPNDPSFVERAAILRPQFERLRADVLLLQEIHGQDEGDGPRGLRALTTLLSATRYRDHQIRSTRLVNGEDVERFRNLVTLIPPDWTFEDACEILHAFTPPPEYNAVTETPERGSRPVRWDRPLLYTPVRPPWGGVVHLLNAHFKSKNPTPIPGQGPENFMWATAGGWAEGFFLSSMKRVGAALEARVFIDTLFAADPEAMIVLGGDLNAESGEVPVRAVRGEVEDHGNSALNGQTMYPCENSVPESARFTLYHRGAKNMLDHLLVSRALMACYRGAEIHSEIVRDESIAFATDKKYPSSDHAPVIAEFDDAMLVQVTGLMTRT